MYWNAKNADFHEYGSPCIPIRFVIPNNSWSGAAIMNRVLFIFEFSYSLYDLKVAYILDAET